MLHDSCACAVAVTLAQVKQLADFKTAELNAKVLQLESHIHWLQQENERLREELQQAAPPGGAAAEANGPALAALQVRSYWSCLYAAMNVQQQLSLHSF
jgi:hypothetical protein